MTLRVGVVVILLGALGCSSRMKTQAPAAAPPPQAGPPAPAPPPPTPAPASAPPADKVAAPSPSSPGYVACEEPRPEICTHEYRPVCASVDTKIRCITAPCPSTGPREYPNGCAACTDHDVFGYVPGTCGRKIHSPGVDPGELPLQ
jgi:hypothetical protein